MHFKIILKYLVLTRVKSCFNKLLFIAIPEIKFSAIIVMKLLNINVVCAALKGTEDKLTKCYADVLCFVCVSH